MNREKIDDHQTCVLATGGYMPAGAGPSVAYIVDDIGGDPDTFRVSWLAWRTPSWQLVTNIVTTEIAVVWKDPTVPVFIDAHYTAPAGYMLTIEIERCPQ